MLSSLEAHICFRHSNVCIIFPAPKLCRINLTFHDFLLHLASQQLRKSIQTCVQFLIQPQGHHHNGRLPEVCIMADGVLKELCLCYCQRQDAVIGLCREHVKNIGTNKVVDMLRSCAKHSIILRMTDPRFCIGGEAIVVAIAAIACLGGIMEHYQAILLALSASCKTEKGPELASWMELIDIYRAPTWRQHHRTCLVLGNRWDSSYHSAKHQLCMAVEIDPSSPSRKVLHQLLSMNLFTSLEGIISTCDPKHVYKRFSTLLQNLLGIVVCELLLHQKI